MDADQLGMMQVLAERRRSLSENGQAMDAIREVARRASHFLGCGHTQANFETAFYRSPIADNNSFEQWQAEGEQDAAQRANKLLQEDAGRSTRRPPSIPHRRGAAANSSPRRRPRCRIRMSEAVHRGGCLCGAVRYEARRVR